MDRVGAALPSLIGKVCRDQGFTQQTLITRWREIVGAEIADCALPTKLRWSRGRGAGATLEIAAEGGYATQIKHIEPVLIDRINTYFGKLTVGRISIVQRALPRARRHLQAERQPIDEEQARQVDAATNDTRDPELRKALRQLGEEMAAGKTGSQTD